MKKKIIFGLGIIALLIAISFNNSVKANPGPAGGDQGKLYGNQSGTKYCCKAGENSCAASEC